MLSNVNYVLINGRRFEIDGSASSLEDIKAAAVEADAGIENADPVIEGDTVVFKYRAGTKGNGLENVTHVLINGRRYEIDGSASSLADIKAAAVEADAGIENADPVIEGDTVVFKYRAGTKGK